MPYKIFDKICIAENNVSWKKHLAEKKLVKTIFVKKKCDQKVFGQTKIIGQNIWAKKNCGQKNLSEQTMWAKSFLAMNHLVRLK